MRSTDACIGGRTTLEPLSFPCTCLEAFNYRASVVRARVAAPLDVVRFVFGSAVLLYASVLDLRTRRVPNPTWYWSGGVGAVLLALDLLVFDRVPWQYLVAIPLIMAVAYALWYFYLIAGGADAKAIMMLAVLVPVPIDLASDALALPVWPPLLAFPPALTIFANSLLAFVLVPLFLLARNLLRGDVRLPAAVLGYTMALDDVERRFVWPMERVDDAGRVRLLLFASKLPPEELRTQLERLRAAGRTRVWVTPKIPFMVPLLVGYVATFVLGDVFTHVLVEPWIGLA